MSLLTLAGPADVARLIPLITACHAEAGQTTTEDHVEQTLATLRMPERVLEVVEGQVVAAVRQRAVRALQHRGVVPAAEVRHHHADIPGTPRGERRCGGGRDVAQRSGGLLDVGARPRRDGGLARERPRHGRGGDAGEICDLLDRGHRRLPSGRCAGAHLKTTRAGAPTRSCRPRADHPGAVRR